MLLEAEDLQKNFKERSVKAVDGVSLSISEGRTLGVVGESGSGKSTLAKLLLRLVPADGGVVRFRGRDITREKEGGLKDFRRSAQVIFQEPRLSLDPRMKVSDILEEPLRVHGERSREVLRKKTAASLAAVELEGRFSGRYPSELSGGECQRVAIARAISLEPALLVCDEAVSALDALVQAQILNLLLRLQQKKNMAYLFISHDLRVVRHMSDEVLVMKEGRVCEAGPRDELFGRPKHPYTRSLLASSGLSAA